MSAPAPSAFHFATLRPHGRAPLLSPPPLKTLLLQRFQETRNRFGLEVAGYVLLDDHAHFLFRMPAQVDAAMVMNDMRGSFLREWRKNHAATVEPTREDVPFWGHGIEYRQTHTRDELRAFLDFIHFDPARHGLVQRPVDYPWSSLPARVEQGHYPDTWGSLGIPASIRQVERGCVGSGSINGLIN